MTAAEAMLIDLPTEITTERLLLRALRPGDGALAYLAVRESLPELKAWLTWASDDYKETDAETWARKSAAEFITRDHLFFRMLLPGSGALIGGISAFKFDWTVPSCEIGYWLHSKHTGHGYMREAVNALTSMVMDQLKMARVQIRVDEGNTRSAMVAEGCGYLLEGVCRNAKRTRAGALCDMRIYSKVP